MAGFEVITYGRFWVIAEAGVLPYVDPVHTMRFKADGRSAQFRWLELPISSCPVCRKPVSSQAIGFLPRTRNSAATADQRSLALVCFLVALL
jgi:hypothetical protein